MDAASSILMAEISNGMWHDPNPSMDTAIVSTAWADNREKKKAKKEKKEAEARALIKLPA